MTTSADPSEQLLQSWTRLEPSPRDPALTEGLQARVADPAWLLARQAAFGELAGTDNAAPAVVRMRARASALTRLRPACQPAPPPPRPGRARCCQPAAARSRCSPRQNPNPHPAGRPGRCSPCRPACTTAGCCAARPAPAT